MYGRTVTMKIDNCKCNNFVKLTSMNKKICSECGKEYEWNLEPDQKPLLNSSRGDRRSHDLINAFDEARMDIIGQNGNDGEAYEKHAN